MPLLRQERSRLLVRAVKSLTDGEQTLFYRKYYYCQSTAQMAAELGLTERGVEGAAVPPAAKAAGAVGR